MKASIQLKIIGIYLCTILIIMMISGSFIIYTTEERGYNSLGNEIAGLAQDIENRYRWNSSSPSDIKNNLVIGTKQIYMLYPDGKVDWGTGKIAEGTTIAEEVVIRAIETDNPATSKFYHFMSSMIGRGYIDHARPILDDLNQIEAIVYIRGETTQITDNMKSIIRTLVTSLVFAMVVMGIFGIFFAKMITAPILELTKSAKKLATGDSIIRIPINSNDEIGELTQSFNYMASQLGSTMETITSEKNKLEKIFEHMADGVMAFNRQGILIHANSVCYDMIGILNMGHRFQTIFENMDLEIDLEALLLNKEDILKEKMVELNGKYLNMHFDIYMNAKKEADGLVVVIQDVTKQQKLDEMRKEFVANVSHELRTPLTTVKSYTETLIDGAIDDREMALHFLGVMDKEADRMTALVHDLLELSRIDNKQIQLNFKPVDLKQLVDDALDAQVIHIEKNGHRLVYNVEPKKDYFIYGDETRIKQVLHNILSNAIKYSVEPGTITVGLKEVKGEMVLTVSDTGMGIPAEDLGRIFERFYRVDKARSRKLGGTGLGLSIAKELVELHGGTIKMESEVGKGTTVIITLKKYIEYINNA